MAKIAILVSGQTRDLDKNWERWLQDVDTLFGEHDYDFYGHTWNDQQDLPDKTANFVKFVKTNQDEVWEGAKPYLWDLIPAKTEWLENQEYIDLLNGKGNMYDFIKGRIIGVYSQMYSHCQVCHIADGNLPNYNAFVRWRWDGGIWEEQWQIHKDAWYKNLNDFIIWQGEYKHKYWLRGDPNICVTQPFIAGRNKFMQDLCWIQNKRATELFMDLENFWHNIHKARIQHSTTYERGTDHHLWQDFIIQNKINILPYAPNIAGHGLFAWDWHKENKQWTN